MLTSVLFSIAQGLFQRLLWSSNAAGELENGVEPVAQLIHTEWDRERKHVIVALNQHHDEVKPAAKSSSVLYRGNMGVIAMTGQNNPVGSPDDPDAALPYLHEQANVLNTLLKNRDVNL